MVKDILDVSFDDAVAMYEMAGFNKAAGILLYLEAFEPFMEQSPHNTDTALYRDLVRTYPLFRPGLLLALVVALPLTAKEAAAVLKLGVPASRLNFVTVPMAAVVASDCSPAPKLPASSNKTISSVPVPSAADDDGFITVGRRRSFSKGKGNAVRQFISIPGDVAADDISAPFQAQIHYARSAGHNAYAQKLRQVGGRNDLRRQGAHVYHERGRSEQHAALMAASRAADVKAAQQDTSFRIDLHGMSVGDGTRIAFAKLQLWWDNAILQREISGSRVATYEIITGAGRHSHGGRSVMKDQVKFYLREECWSFEDIGGSFIVKGKKKR